MRGDGDAGHHDEDGQGCDVGEEKEDEHPGEGGDFRQGESDEEPAEEFGGEVGEGGAGRLSSRQDLDEEERRAHAEYSERERADGKQRSCWGIGGSGEPRVEQVEAEGEVQNLGDDELDGQESEPAAEGNGLGRRQLGWLSGHRQDYTGVCAKAQ